MSKAQPAPVGFVLRPDEGEAIPRRRAVIKVSTQAGSSRFGMATQRLEKGETIPVHMHERADEVFFVHRGEGIVILGEERIPISEGCVVFIPQGTWHGFESHSDELYLVWAISPPDFVDLFRQVYATDPPSPETITALMAAHGFRRYPS